MKKKAISKIEPIYKKLGKLIVDARHRKGITQEVLALRMGISRPSLANIEVGRQRIALHVLLRFEKKLGLIKYALLMRL